MENRIAKIQRQTKETDIVCELNLDGVGRYDIDSGAGFLDHMLTHLSKHGRIDLVVKAKGDLHIDPHHTTEDIGLCLGDGLLSALGDKRGIARYGHSSVPMEDALANVSLDLSGRAAVVFNVQFTGDRIGAFDVQLVEEFLRRMANAAGINMHVNVLAGTNDHHIAEAVFKAFAQALRQAKEIDPQRHGQIPSTKGRL